jgi:hypothetical protein
MLLKKILNNLRTIVQNRFIHREVRAKLKEKKSPKNLALEYFDFFYASSYQEEWNKMRVALLTGSKYVALVNNYSLDWHQTEQDLKQMTALNMLDFLAKLNAKNNAQSDAKYLDLMDKIKMPKAFKAFCFDSGDVRQFKQPKADSLALLSSRIYH